MVVRAKRRMITRAKTKGEMALMRSRMQRIQKERVSIEFEEAEILRQGPQARLPGGRSIPKRQRKITITQERQLGSSLVLSIQAKRTSPALVDIYVHFPSEWYAILAIPIVLYNRWVAGDAKAKTNDIRRYKSGKKKGALKAMRWWKNKYPSQGAFYNQYIKGKFTHIPISGPPSGATDVFGDDEDFGLYGEEAGAPITNG